MNTTFNLEAIHSVYHHTYPTPFYSDTLNKPVITKLNKIERKIIKAFLINHLHKIFCEIFREEIDFNDNIFLTEHYIMDTKIIQLLIQGIIETGEYTLEGIAYYTGIPFDVLYDAASGINNQLSITPWVKIMDLYLQVKPEISNILLDRFLEIKTKTNSNVTAFLHD